MCSFIQQIFLDILIIPGQVIMKKIYIVLNWFTCCFLCLSFDILNISLMDGHTFIQGPSAFLLTFTLSKHCITSSIFFIHLLILYGYCYKCWLNIYKFL